MLQDNSLKTNCWQTQESEKTLIREAIKLIEAKNNFYILCHKSPDGDAVSSAVAMYLALQQKGKRSKILCNDPIPKKYSYIMEDVDQSLEFRPDCIISVDVAGVQLLGKNLKEYENIIDLNIDHHVSNSNFAKLNVVRGTAAANTELIYDILLEMGIKIDRRIAECIYTGIATDTGCFRYSNVTEHTHELAALMIRYGARSYFVNKKMFETKSRACVDLERAAMENMEFYFNDQCAIMNITLEMMNNFCVDDGELDGVASIPAKIDGVKLAITLLQKDNFEYKVSVRTGEDINACDFCKAFGGGGHIRAAGCLLYGTLTENKEKLLKKAEQILNDLY